VVTIFVNPTQFGANEDFDKYPRTLAADLEVCEAQGVDYVFTPSVEDVYGSESRTSAAITVDPGPLGSELEGAARPDHFRGVLTVVAKLMHMTRPAVALFGEKDYQQLTLIRAMVSALDFPVEVIGVPTVREPDGLAMSSRNRFLTAAEREAAASIPSALSAAAATGSAAKALEVIPTLLDPMVVCDYAVIRGVDLGEPPNSGEARLLFAGTVGSTRLLDNVRMDLGA
jgi:pantoate--beta-alanine ligase